MMVYQHILNRIKEGKKSLTVLIDPDKINDQLSLIKVIKQCEVARVNFIFIGGSSLSKDNFHTIAREIKSITDIPLVIFPGNHQQISHTADAILFLSLISGRNPEYLIGQHVLAAPKLKRSGLEIIPTGYLLIDSGKITSVHYISNTFPIPRDKPSIAAHTAMAGEMIGMKMIYLEAGSGALYTVPLDMISEVKESIEVPLIVGGGIRKKSTLREIFEAGADMVVIGNIIEKDPDFLNELAEVAEVFC